MENFNQAIDLDLVQESQTYQDASKGTRFANFIIDMIILIIIAVIWEIAVGPINPGADFLISILINATYFIILEASTGKSIGKMFTKTKVVTENGQTPSFGQLVGRSFARFIPFEPFSFLGSKDYGWHDSLSGTRVVKEN